MQSCSKFHVERKYPWKRFKHVPNRIGLKSTSTTIHSILLHFTILLSSNFRSYFERNTKRQLRVEVASHIQLCFASQLAIHYNMYLNSSFLILRRRIFLFSSQVSVCLDLVLSKLTKHFSKSIRLIFWRIIFIWITYIFLESWNFQIWHNTHENNRAWSAYNVT